MWARSAVLFVLVSVCVDKMRFLTAQSVCSFKVSPVLWTVFPISFRLKTKTNKQKTKLISESLWSQSWCCTLSSPLLPCAVSSFYSYILICFPPWIFFSIFSSFFLSFAGEWWETWSVCGFQHLPLSDSGCVHQRGKPSRQCCCRWGWGAPWRAAVAERPALIKDPKRRGGGGKRRR